MQSLIDGRDRWGNMAEAILLILLRADTPSANKFAVAWCKDATAGLMMRTELEPNTDPDDPVGGWGYRGR
jgi:hypothetical protein